MNPGNDRVSIQFISLCAAGFFVFPMMPSGAAAAKLRQIKITVPVVLKNLHPDVLAYSIECGLHMKVIGYRTFTIWSRASQAVNSRILIDENVLVTFKVGQKYGMHDFTSKLLYHADRYTCHLQLSTEKDKREQPSLTHHDDEFKARSGLNSIFRPVVKGSLLLIGFEVGKDDVSSPQSNLPPPKHGALLELNKDKTGCICPPGTSQRGDICMPCPPDVTDPIEMTGFGRATPDLRKRSSYPVFPR